MPTTSGVLLLLLLLLFVLVGRLPAPSAYVAVSVLRTVQVSSCNQVDPAVFFWSWRSPP
jgi:hypothetical protein